MTSCLTSRLGAVRYMKEILIPRLNAKGVPIDPDRDWSLPEFTTAIIKADAVDILLKNEFPPVCLERIAPCLDRIREGRVRGALWKDGFEQVLRTLVTAKLYLEAEDESQIAKKMAAIQRLSSTLACYFDANCIEDFIGGIREALASIPRYTKDPELTFKASCFFEQHKMLDEIDVDRIIDEAHTSEVQTAPSPWLHQLFKGYELEFESAVSSIQASSAR